MKTFISSGPPYYVRGRGIVRRINPDGYDLTWGELNKLIEGQEFVQLDTDIVTLGGIESFANIKYYDKKYSFPIGLLIKEVRN